jgi:hypothetical protein
VHDGQAREGDLDQGLELRGLLGGAPAEEPHGWLAWWRRWMMDDSSSTCREQYLQRIRPQCLKLNVFPF